MCNIAYECLPVKPDYVPSDIWDVTKEEIVRLKDRRIKMDMKFIMKINEIIQEEIAKCDPELLDLSIANGDGDVIVGTMDPLEDGSEFLVKIFNSKIHKESYLPEWFDTFRQSKKRLSEFVILDRFTDMHFSLSDLFFREFIGAINRALTDKSYQGGGLTLKNVKSKDLKTGGELNG